MVGVLRIIKIDPGTEHAIRGSLKMTYDFSLFVSVFQVRLCGDFLFVILYLYKAVRIMPLKAFNVPVSLFLEGEAPKCPPPTLNFLPSVRARDSWNS